MAQESAGNEALMNETNDPKRLIDIKAAASYTDLSVHTIYGMVSQRRIPYVKVGRLVKFDLALIDAWIKKRTVMPLPQQSS